ncbi:hypothetical protein D3C86_155100 [compost metagenome]
MQRGFKQNLLQSSPFADRRPMKKGRIKRPLVQSSRRQADVAPICLGASAGLSV